MIVPVMNPERPPRFWWRRMYAKQLRRYSPAKARAVTGHIWFHRVPREKKMEIYRREILAGNRSIKQNSPSKRRETMAKTGQHRPRIRFFGGKWHRSKKSRLFGGPVMLNPRRRRRRGRRSFTFRHNPFVSVRYPHRRHRRHNPGINLRGITGGLRRSISRPWLTQVATVGAGLAAGMAGRSLVQSLMPRIGLGNFTQYSGAGNIVLGSVIAATMRQKIAKEIGVMLAAIGVYDLIQANVPMLNLPAFPSIDLLSMVPGMGAPRQVSASYPVPSLPISPVARLSSSYAQASRPGYAGSYLAPDMRQEGFHGDSDSPYEGIF